MPNWCENRVSITAEADQIKEIKELFSQDNPFSKILPQPSEEELPQDNDFTPGWYSWRVNHWGTKWDIEAADVSFVEDEDEYLQMMFMTAWAPPCGICEKLREMYEDASITWFYDEPGIQDAGYI
jgi:hypothetical protein